MYVFLYGVCGDPVMFVCVYVCVICVIIIKVFDYVCTSVHVYVSLYDV